MWPFITGNEKKNNLEKPINTNTLNTNTKGFEFYMIYLEKFVYYMINNNKNNSQMLKRTTVSLRKRGWT